MEDVAGFTVSLEGESSGHGLMGRRQFQRRRRNRHGRGLRTPLLPADAPAALSRSEQFDQYVLESAERLHQLWGTAIESIEFHVEEIPADLETLAALGNTIPFGTQRPGTAGDPGAIIIYRHPVETAARLAERVPELVHDAVVEQAAELLGLSPEAVDPTYGHYSG